MLLSYYDEIEVNISTESNLSQNQAAAPGSELAAAQESAAPAAAQGAARTAQAEGRVRAPRCDRSLLAAR